MAVRRPSAAAGKSRSCWISGPRARFCLVEPGGGAAGGLARRGGALGYVQYFANMTTTLASSSHEIINPANVIQPRAFVIAETVARLFNFASASIAPFSLSAGVTSCPVARSTTFDGWGDATEPVPLVEGNFRALSLGSTPIDSGRAFFFRGRGGRLFFMAYVPYTLTIAARQGCEVTRIPTTPAGDLLRGSRLFPTEEPSCDISPKALPRCT